MLRFLLCQALRRKYYSYNFQYGVVGTADASARYLEGPAAAADVFVYPDDQLIRLAQADALYEVTRNHDAIVAANSQGSVNAATYQGMLLGYPMTADNGYFLFYDKSVLTEEDVKTLDGINAQFQRNACSISPVWLREPYVRLSQWNILQKKRAPKTPKRRETARGRSCRLAHLL